MMRTTLDIEDDVLEVAKSLAKHRRLSLGRAVSDLIRKSIQPHAKRASTQNGLRVIARGPGSKPVTLDIVNRLRDE
jgi:hypothetical protein